VWCWRRRRIRINRPAPRRPSGRNTRPTPIAWRSTWAKKLGLSQDQVAQIKPVLEDRTQKMQALRADASLSPQDRRAKAQDIMQDSKNKIEAVLNDTQKQQFEQMLAERRGHRRGQPQGE